MLFSNSKILPALLFIYTTAFAQIDTTLRDFFPMQIGNYWEYMDEDFILALQYSHNWRYIDAKP